MAAARFYDGLTSQPWPIDVVLAGDVLVFEAEGVTRRWPLGGLTIDAAGGVVRLSRSGDDERLLIDGAVWRAFAGAQGRAAEKRSRFGEWKLVAGLAVAGVLLTLLVFVGVPAVSGPLARMTPPAFERRIGENFEAQLSVGLKPCGGREGQAALAAFGRRLGRAAQTPFDIRVRAVEAPITNAFALPGGAVMVTDDLIGLTQTPDELAAVIAHETAHVEKRHVMQAVWRSLGLGLVLDAVVGGGSGAGQQAVLLAGSFTDLRFSRQAEAQADSRGMELLQAQGLSSKGMAPFFERLAAKGEGAEARAVKELISSHPDTIARARVSRLHARPGASAFSPREWAAIKAACATPRSTGGSLRWIPAS